MLNIHQMHCLLKVTYITSDGPVNDVAILMCLYSLELVPQQGSLINKVDSIWGLTLVHVYRLNNVERKIFIGG